MFGIVGNTAPFSRANHEAYRYHPMEIPAYRYESEFAQKYGWYQSLPIEIFVENYPNLICKHSGNISRPPLWAWAMGGLVALLVCIVKPIMDLVLGGAACLVGKR